VAHRGCGRRAAAERVTADRHDGQAKSPPTVPLRNASKRGQHPLRHARFGRLAAASPAVLRVLSWTPTLTRLGAREEGVWVDFAATLQPRLLAVRFAVELRLDAPRLAAELGFPAGRALPCELRSFCSCSRSRRTALFIFSRSRRASRRSLATSLRRSFLPVRMLPWIAPSSFSVTSSAFLMRAIARPFCSNRARAAAVTRGWAAGFLAVV
jgi:hypothetical protein